MGKPSAEYITVEHTLWQAFLIVLYCRCVRVCAQCLLRAVVVLLLLLLLQEVRFWISAFAL